MLKEGIYVQLGSTLRVVIIDSKSLVKHFYIEANNKFSGVRVIIIRTTSD